MGEDVPHHDEAARNGVMRLSLAQAPWLARPAVQTIFAMIAEAGHEARAVGGCVRDSLLARDTHSDVDFATTMPPDRLMVLFQEAGIRAIPTGLPHGTVTLIIGPPPQNSFEVTTLRHDMVTDGRHAQVAYTDDWLADAQRRDFSINALYADAAGEVYDPLAAIGQSAHAALLAGRLEFIGDADQRITEDVLRVLRFFRFHYELFAQTPPDRAALAAITLQADRLHRLSGERVRHELIRILSLPMEASAALAALVDCGVWAGLFGVAPPPNVLATLTRNGTTAAQAYEWHQEANARAFMRLAMLMPGRARAVAERLRLSNKEADYLLTLDDVGIQNEVERAWSENDAAALDGLLYQYGCRAIADHVWRVYRLAFSLRDKVGLDDTDRDELPPEDAQFSDWQAHIEGWQKPTCPISAGDFMENGMAAGPELGRILKQCERQWIQSHFQLGRDDLLAWGLAHTAPSSTRSK